MFQTFSKAWGIKPKAFVEKASVVLNADDIKEVNSSENDHNLKRNQKEHSKEDIFKDKEKVKEKEQSSETVSLAYHKHIVFLLFLLNIISLIVVFLLAVLK
jgi:hypothetical protein